MGKGTVRQRCLLCSLWQLLLFFFQQMSQEKEFLEEMHAFSRCYRDFLKPRDSFGETTRPLFENKIQKLFFLCIKTSDFLKQSCNASVGTGLVDVSFVLRLLLPRVQFYFCFLLTDQRGPCTARSMEWTSSDTHMLPTPSCTAPTKQMVSGPLEWSILIFLHWIISAKDLGKSCNNSSVMRTLSEAEEGINVQH